jgi:hypothetical protein
MSTPKLRNRPEQNRNVAWPDGDRMASPSTVQPFSSTETNQVMKAPTASGNDSSIRQLAIVP